MITYLLGAGASCNAVPLVKGIPKELELFNDTLQRKVNTHNKYPIFKEHLNWLQQEASSHDTIDTFAKKLFLTNKLTELKRLKAVLSAYFIWRQAIQPFDKRYDTFIASIATRERANLLLPEFMRVLTWNYDMQFEIALYGFTERSQFSKKLFQNDDISHLEPEFNNIANMLNSYPYLNSFYDDTKFAHIRLNGVAGSTFKIKKEIDSEEIKNPPLLFTNVAGDSEEMLVLIGLLENYSESQPIFINFAWENNDITTRTLENAKRLTALTEILVIVGYSFPFFNREIDREIIGGMEKLKKVYIQDPNAKGVRDRFSSIKNGFDEAKLICKEETDQYFLPPEL
jgi:hypothetical protein